jgi:hypothetical protein
MTKGGHEYVCGYDLVKILFNGYDKCLVTTNTHYERHGKSNETEPG